MAQAGRGAGAARAGERQDGGTRWRRRRHHGPDNGQVYAALDLGTNNCRLLVARPARGGFRVIDAFSRIVRLGERLGATGRLSDDAMDRTIDALKVCAAKMRRRGVTRARNVATAACRKARNCPEFLARVEAETGLTLETISSGEEASLAMTGCIPLLDGGARHAIVFDIGGGSTELTWAALGAGAEPEVAAWTSLPEGVVSLAESFGGHEVTAERFDAMVALIRGHLVRFEDAHGLNRHVAGGAVQMLGTSGTVTTLAGMHLGLQRYDRSRVDGTWISFAEAARMIERLRSMPYGERIAHPCIGRGRADLVIGGCAILRAICQVWPVGRLRVGDRGVREGVLMSLINADNRARPAGA